jgi:hypothetical protein
MRWRHGWFVHVGIHKVGSGVGGGRACRNA